MHGWEINDDRAAAGITAGNSAWQAAQAAQAQLLRGDAAQRRN